MEFYYVMTVVHQPRSGVLGYGTKYGTYQAENGATRESVFTDIRTRVAASIGISPESMNVLFFSLEPNKIPMVTPNAERG